MPRKRRDEIPRKIFSARIDERMARAIKKLAAEEDTDIYYLIEEAIADLFSKRGRSAIKEGEKKHRK